MGGPSGPVPSIGNRRACRRTDQNACMAPPDSAPLTVAAPPRWRTPAAVRAAPAVRRWCVPAGRPCPAASRATRSSAWGTLCDPALDEPAVAEYHPADFLRYTEHGGSSEERIRELDARLIVDVPAA
jgi:hypothetical protein